MDEIGMAIRALQQKEVFKQKEVEAIHKAIEQLEILASLVEPESTPASMDYAGLSITEATKRLLKEKGPLSTRQIADELIRRGITTNSKNFAMTVYVILREAEGIARNTSKKWELADAPIAE